MKQMDGSVRKDGEVDTWDWAETSPTEDIMSWLTNGFDANRTQDTAVLVKVCERLDKTIEEVVDIIYPG